MRAILIFFLLILTIDFANCQTIEVQNVLTANRIEGKLRARGQVVSGHFVDGFVPVETLYKKSFADSNGRLISSIEYSNVRDFHNGYAAVKRDDGWTIIDSEGKEQFEPNKLFARIEKVSKGKMVVLSKKENLAGLARITGDLVAPMQYRFLNLLDTSSGNYLATSNGKYQLLDSLGKPFSENWYEDFSAAENSTSYAANFDGKWMILDLKGKPRITPSLHYDFVEAFSNGLAVVRKDGKSGYINEVGKEVLPLIYDDAFAFTEFGHATVKLGVEFAIIDRFGKCFLKGNYELLAQVAPNSYRIMTSEGQYLLDSMGKKLWPEVCYEITPIAYNLYKVIPLTEERKPYFANENGIKIADYEE